MTAGRLDVDNPAIMAWSYSFRGTGGVAEEGNPDLRSLPTTSAGLWTGAESWEQGMGGRKSEEETARMKRRGGLGTR